MFSKACEYGIKAAIYIAANSNEGKRVSLKGIAKHIDSPEAFTAKILQILARENIVTSVRGINGGFEIESHKLETIFLSDIVKAIDGDNIYKGCGIGLKDCNELHPCPIHDDFKKVRNSLRKLLETTHLKQLALNVHSGTSFLRV
ncbi:RrF2 family transcriptional regulator [Mangrovimonas spongiae]|uniref:Rrf2 family transcriptional regulator n=1 Tax=Mangrovimonas spongiae TaxID=2494697 RepID=A0A428JX31_9FLAO|nr:Rrf2 family transcriptional regulator [Mangrovimonas spongiae]RSK38655.1 Rrf2 family transcriptional regulator [Mangrovimonas spongiae]